MAQRRGVRGRVERAQVRGSEPGRQSGVVGVQLRGGGGVGEGHGVQGPAVQRRVGRGGGRQHLAGLLGGRHGPGGRRGAHAAEEVGGRVVAGGEGVEAVRHGVHGAHQVHGVVRELVLLQAQRLGLAPRPVLVVRVLLHVQGPEPLGLVDEGPLLRLAQQLPLGAQPLGDLRVVHLGVLLRHLAALAAGPHHEGVHGSLDVRQVRRLAAHSGREAARRLATGARGAHGEVRGRDGQPRGRD